MSLMSSLYIGVSGLGSSQNSLNTTAHNLANVDTTGFVRQQVLQTDRTYNKWGVTHLSTMQSGLGVNIATVRQVRDMFLDKSYRKELGRQGFYDVQYEAVQEIESTFGEMEGVAFQKSLEDMWTSFQELAKAPDATSIEVRASVVQNAITFITRAENISNQLKDYQKNLNTQITDKVNRVNEISESIKNLNGKIRQFESNGQEHANDLRDERNNLLDELGQIVSITYKENSDGSVNVNAEGYPLVSEDTAYKMGTAKVSESSELLKPVWASYGNVDVYNLDYPASSENDTDIGSLKGLLVARGDREAKYTDIPNPGDPDYDNKVKEYNRTINASVIMSVQAQFDQLIHGIVTKINDILSPTKNVTLGSGTVLRVFDETNAPAGMDTDKTMGEELFSRKSCDRYRTPTAAEIADSGGQLTASSKVYIEEDPADKYSLYTIGEIEINKEIKNNYSKLPLMANSGNGWDKKTVDALTTVWNEKFAAVSPNSLTKNTFKEYYNAFVGEWATRGEQLYSISTNQATLVSNIDDQRQRVAGVSSDEELTNLIKYQHAYNASSRYINVIDQMLEHVINRLGS